MVAWTSCNKLAFVKAALGQFAFQNLDLIAVFLLRAEAGFLFKKVRCKLLF